MHKIFIITWEKEMPEKKEYILQFPPCLMISGNYATGKDDVE